jgi:hypothetical protein
MACYMDSFTFLYVDDVRNSQEAHVWACITCYGDIFTLLLLSLYSYMTDYQIYHGPSLFLHDNIPSSTTRQLHKPIQLLCI